MAQTPISNQDAGALAEKLAAFSETLAPGELAIFEMLEQHLGTQITGADDDVSGYMMQLDQMAALRQQDLLAEADRERLARQAVQTRPPGDSRSKSTRAGFWTVLITSLTADRGVASPAAGSMGTP